MSGGMGFGVAWYGFNMTVGVIFENIEFFILGIVGIVGAGRGIARCRYEEILEYALVILEPYSSATQTVHNTTYATNATSQKPTQSVTH